VPKEQASTKPVMIIPLSENKTVGRVKENGRGRKPVISFRPRSKNMVVLLLVPRLTLYQILYQQLKCLFLPLILTARKHKLLQII
jgi:hypothetical protein